jgi:hypothetical protein
MGWWNRIKSPECYPHKHNHLIFDKGANNSMEKGFSITGMGCWCPA